MGDPDVRLQAVLSIGALATEGRSRSRMVVHGLCKVLDDSVPQVRDAAVRQLIAVCWSRRTAIDALAERLTSKNEVVRKAASIAFRGVVADVPESRRRRATDRTMKLLGHLDAGVREAAAAAMEVGKMSEADIAAGSKVFDPFGKHEEPESPVGRADTKRSTNTRRSSVDSRADTKTSLADIRAAAKEGVAANVASRRGSMRRAS